MKLQIKGTEEETAIIELEKLDFGVYVKINDENVAFFWIDGEFDFMGKSNETQFKGCWKEENSGEELNLRLEEDTEDEVGTGIKVCNNGELIAIFWDEGLFDFYGKEIKTQFTGRWDK